jgi:hypothetical protein
MMKQSVCPLLLIVVFISCNKDSTLQPGASGSIQYKVNGNDYSIENIDYTSGQYVIMAKQLAPAVITTRYTLNAQKGANNIVIFTILTDSLKKTSYHYDSTALSVGGTHLITYNGQGSYVLTKNDYFDITITDYSNRHVSGTFTAKLAPANSLGTIGTPSSVTVTEGKLNNIQVIY